MKSYNIGIDIQSTLGPTTGLGVYTNLLVQGLKAVGMRHSLELLSYKNRDLNTVQRLWWENFVRPSLIKGDNLDLIHIPAFSPGFTKAKKQVITVHDLIVKRFPQNLPLVSRIYWSQWLPAQAVKSDHIIVDSENTKHDLMQFYKIPESKISVIYLCVSGKFHKEVTPEDRKRVRDSYGLHRPYFLSVSTLEPRKNFPRLVKAYANFKKREKSEAPQLVLTGLLKWGSEAVKRQIQEEGLKLGEDVVLTGYVPTEDLPPLFAGAEAFLYPSLYEGFGLPALESMTVGTPVIASNTSSIPEVVGDAGILIDPLSTKEMVEAMALLWKDKTKQTMLRKTALEQSRKFSQEKMARETLAVYEKVMEG